MRTLLLFTLSAILVVPVSAATCDSDVDADGLCDDSDACIGDNASGDTDADGWCAASIDGTVADCDDADASTFPGAQEQCDGKDNACDGGDLVAELDADGDGVRRCDGDCDDTDPDVLPGAEEACNGLDDDCDGAPLDTEVDADADGFLACDGDCDDADAATNPFEADVCDDGLDNDCDGEPDEGCTAERVDPGPGCWCSTGSTNGGAPSGAALWLGLAAAAAVAWRRR